MGTINIVFKGGAAIWETDWLKEIFCSDSSFNFHFQNSKPALPNTLIVTKNPLEHLFKDYINQGLDFAIINLKDEFIPTKQDHSIYKSKYCKFIFRNYFNPSYSQENLLSFPLGYKSGFWSSYSNKSKLIAQRNNTRKYLWSFAGTTKKSGRGKSISNLKSLTPYYIHSTSGWNTSDSLTTLEYRDLMLNSQFTPSFRGACNLECYRTYEALESGSIPILQRYSHIQNYDFYNLWYGDNHPLLLVDDLFDKNSEYNGKARPSPQAYNIINSYCSDKEKLSLLRQETCSWWSSYKNNLKNKVSSIYRNIFNF